MNQTSEILLSTLRTAAWGEEIYPVTMPADADLGALEQELREQSVYALCVDVMGKYAGQDCLRYAARSLSNWHSLMNGQQRILSALAQAGIPAVVLKGAAADIYYPKPEYRAMGDVDLLIQPADFDRAVQCLQEIGALMHGDNGRHVEGKLGKTSFELHRYFTVEGGKPLDGLLFAAMDRRCTATLCGYDFPMLPPVENGIVLLGHIKQHLHGGLGLRQIMDWMFYVHTYLTDDFYDRDFAPVARSLGLDTLAVTVTGLCRKYLGLSMDITWCDGADDALCGRLLEFLLERGNFGMKDIQSTATATVLVKSKDPLRLLRWLQERGCQKWAALRKYPFLKPFAWIYQIFRVLHRGLERQDAVRELWQDKQKADAQYALLKDLGLE